MINNQAPWSLSGFVVLGMVFFKNGFGVISQLACQNFDRRHMKQTLIRVFLSRG